MKLFINASIAMTLLLIGTSCGGSAPKESTTALDVESTDGAEQIDNNTGSGVQVDGILGTIPQEEVDRVFDNHMDGLFNCYNLAIEDLEEIEGQIEFAMQVDTSGSVVQAHIKRGDLGSLETEKCMVNKVERFMFRRQGSGIAHVTKELTLEAPYDPAEPNTWGDTVVKEIVNQNQIDVDKCLGGRTGVQLTIYVWTGGVVASAGASTETHELRDAGYCLAKAARNWTFPDPGQNVVKMSLDF
ncbi:MAG: AgmX/PglI C-terminal domain-containing protein [Proteobacteria bacterium]|nr:AgmX/PglI C-terminal domain-containing protein [Pseudomonadota bacterium]